MQTIINGTLYLLIIVVFFLGGAQNSALRKLHQEVQDNRLIEDVRNFQNAWTIGATLRQQLGEEQALALLKRAEEVTIEQFKDR